MELINGLGGAAGFGENRLPAILDGSSREIDLSAVFPNGLSYFGRSFDSVFVNSNGNLTFDAPLSEFVPNDISTLDFAGLFAFWTDIDVGRRPVDASPGGTSQGTNRVWYDLDTQNRTFTATWDDVRPYDERVPGEVDAFQIRLVDLSDEPGRDPGAFRAELRYETIDWVGGVNVFGNITARIGFTVGDGQSFVELGASNEQAALAILPEQGVLSFVFDDGGARGADPTEPIRGTDGDDVLEGTGGVDAFSPGAGTDTVRPGGGADAVLLSDGAKTVAGSAGDLLGDRLIGAGWDDSLLFEGEAFGRDAVSVTQDGRALSFDLDGDGLSDGTIALDAQLLAGEGTVLTSIGAEGTRVSYLRALPDLAPGDAVRRPDRFDGGPAAEAYLTGAAGVDFVLTVRDAANAAPGTALGIYELDADGALLDGRLLTTDLPAAGAFRIADVEAGRALSVFLLTPNEAEALDVADDFDFVDPFGGPATLDDRSYVFAASEGRIVDGTLVHAADPRLNQDLRPHALIGGRDDSPGVTLAFETSLSFDGPGGGTNADFADLVLSVERVAAEIV